eukprot:13122442-Alexandrium_andersonii.AAC.1
MRRGHISAIRDHPLPSCTWQHACPTPPRRAWKARGAAKHSHHATQRLLCLGDTVESAGIPSRLFHRP